MSEQDTINRKAWNPLTFRGLSLFARAKLPRLLLVSFVFSLTIFASVAWFISRNYVPTITRALLQLPETASLENGELKGLDKRIEAETKFLSVVVDTNDVSDTGTADVQVAFTHTNLFVCSSASSSWGCLAFGYPADGIDLSRSTAEPWWGAWRPFIVAGIGLSLSVGTVVVMLLIATVLMWLAKYFAYFADRDLSSYGAWKLAVAGQLPGLIVIAAAIFLYGVQAMDWLGLGVFYVLHILVDLVYISGAVVFLPRLSGTITSNPFGAKPSK